MNAVRLALPAALAVALLVPAQADARLVHAQLGSGVCKATDGNNTNLSYQMFYLRNNNPGIKNVTCNTPFVREELVKLMTNAGYSLQIVVSSAVATPQNVTCIASAGSNASAAQSAKTMATSAAASARFSWNASELPTFNNTDSLAVICGLAPNTAVGLYVATQPEVQTVVP